MASKEGLTDEELDGLMASYKATGDIAARDAIVLGMVERWRPMFRAMARKNFRSRPDAAEELEQDAAAIFAWAMDRFDPARATDVGAYLYAVLRQRLWRHASYHLGPTPLDEADMQALKRIAAARRTRAAAGLECDDASVIASIRFKAPSYRERAALLLAMTRPSRWLRATASPSPGEGEWSLVPTPSEEPSPDDAAERSEELDRLRGWIARLGSERAAIFREYHLEGRRIKDIAASRGRGGQWVTNRLRECMAEVREMAVVAREGAAA